MHSIVLYLCRIHASKKTTKRFQKDIQLLVERLDSHEDPFRTMPIEEPDTMTKPRSVIKPQAAPKQADKQNATGGKKQATKRKSKADRVCYHYTCFNLNVTLDFCLST